MNNGSGLGRRGFLRGLGAAVTLPALESMRPLLAATASRVATTASGSPLRMAYLYIPNGVNLEHWRPSGTAANPKLGKSMAPLEGLKDHFQIFTGFSHQHATAGKDGAGDHARSNATFLTGQRAKKTSGADIKVGVSVDQIAARAAQDLTRLPSLELTCDGVRKSGKCDSGYSCAYQFNLSWRSDTQPMTPEGNPRLVFERLFGAGSAQERKKSLSRRMGSQKSILDFISDDAKAMQRRLGRNDQHKLDEYLTGVREIERRIGKAETFNSIDPGVPAPEGTPNNYAEHMQLMMDMMVLAFQTDSTRVSTFLMAHDGSNRNFKEIGVSEGHHNLSHHKSQKDNLEKIQKIDQFYLTQLAYFFQKMKDTEDVDGKSLLDNSMIVYGSGIADGNRHNHNDLPIIVGGGGGGALTPGRHVDLGEEVPLSNLYVRMLNEFGVDAKRFGDSTGALRKV
ncbi:DUF1552 domain-containing protein [Akkermansiaceae bacterium]|nr:DUF1552 domain-containing protein [Akkermansiaceae bacterium]MDB4537646.1 DUF1552 domain-containing protein [Akkermansiaceae bacterium]